MRYPKAINHPAMYPIIKINERNGMIKVLIFLIMIIAEVLRTAIEILMLRYMHKTVKKKTAVNP